MLVLVISYVGVVVVFGYELYFEGLSMVFGVGLVFVSVISYVIYLVFSGCVV